MEAFIEHIATVLNQEIIQVHSISGGDISQAYQVSTLKQHFFLKQNSSTQARAMFETEKQGLDSIAATKTIAVPQVFDVGLFDGTAYILMEYIEAKAGMARDFKTLAHQLAALHRVYSPQFGLETDNFIGSLTQTNAYHNNWTDFYLRERLLPQLELAQSKGLLSPKELPSSESMLKVLQPYFEGCSASLIHGDLWSGNFLFGIDGTPYLIDPAVYFGHHEVDIAMTQLFGGFPSSFYETYHEIHPKSSDTNTRINLYQLYYLLVHLNLFGSSYYKSVKRILGTYF